MEYNFTEQQGWKTTRASGILAILVSTYDLSWDDIYAWCHANGLDDWEPSTQNSDYSASVGSNGSIYFAEEFPLPDDWKTRWSAFTAGTLKADLPALPEPGSPADAVLQATVATIEPIQVATTVQTDSAAVEAVAVQESAAAVPAAMPIYPPEPIAEPTLNVDAIPQIVSASQAATASTGNAQNGLLALGLI